MIYFTHELLLETVTYDPTTGLFRWRIPRPKIQIGRVAGHKHFRKGEIRIVLYGRTYAAHRLAWFYVHGSWPKHQIDHKDRITSHNWIDNLREATNGQNCANRGAFGRVGLKGVTLHRSGRFHAQITFNKKCRSLGYFNSAEEAHAVYVEAARRLHGEFASAS